MGDSETTGADGDFDLYQTAQRLSSLLYAVSNATGYVRLCTEERLKWACASDAERLVHELFNFTNRTANDKPIWCDRFFEWFQRDIRKYTGKKYYRGLERRLPMLVSMIPELVRNKEQATTRSKVIGREDAAAAAAEVASVSAREARSPSSSSTGSTHRSTTRCPRATTSS